MGTCISIPNSNILPSHIYIYITINNTIYPLYSSHTNMKKWFIYIPPFIKKEFNKSNLSHIHITYTHKNKIYKCLFTLDDKYNITKDSNLFKINVLYGYLSISQFIIQFDK
jgi:hypothetical protein